MAKVAPVKAGWYNAFRPWTLHGAVVPVVLGGVVAFNDGFFNWWIFILVLAGGILLQSAANLLNTYGDFVKGTDTEDNHSRSPELVSGKMRPKQILGAGLACLAITALIGTVFIWYIGWGILAFGILGILGAGSYTLGVAYKYRAMGQISTFFLMGVLMPAGTYYTMAGAVSLETVILGLPNAFTITGVLSGNETRDYYSDKDACVGTLSGHMSYQGALRFYRTVNAMCYPILAVAIVIGAVPWTCVLAYVALIDYRNLYLNSLKAPEDKRSSFMLVPEAFKHNWHFGGLLAIGYLIGVSVVPVLI